MQQLSFALYKILERRLKFLIRESADLRQTKTSKKLSISFYVFLLAGFQIFFVGFHLFARTKIFSHHNPERHFRMLPFFVTV